MTINLGPIVATVDGDHLTGEPVKAQSSNPNRSRVRLEHRMILNPAQAEAVYSAMCALNNVAGRVRIYLDDGVVVSESKEGRVYVMGELGSEVFATQASFATAYGLNADAPRPSVEGADGNFYPIEG